MLSGLSAVDAKPLPSLSHTPALNCISMWVKRKQQGNVKITLGYGGKCLQPQLLPELRQEDSPKISSSMYKCAHTSAVPMEAGGGDPQDGVQESYSTLVIATEQQVFSRAEEISLHLEADP